LVLNIKGLIKNQGLLVYFTGFQTDGEIYSRYGDKLNIGYI